MHHRMPPPKTGWPSLNVVIFPPVMRLVLDDPKPWPPRRLLIKFTSLSWKTAGFRLNQELSNWASHVSGLGPTFTKIWTCGNYPRSESRNAQIRFNNVNGASRLSKFGFFSDVIQMISCRDWWPWKKSGYITMTRRQSNNQWSGGIAAHPAPKNSECKNQLEKFSPRFSFGIKTASSWLIIFERAKLLTRINPHLCWCNWRIFWRKSRGKITKAVLFLHENAPAHRALATKETGLPGLPMSWALTLFSGSGPVGLPSVSWIEKKMKFAIFRPPRALLPRRPGWTDNLLIFFWMGGKR